MWTKGVSELFPCKREFVEKLSILNRLLFLLDLSVMVVESVFTLKNPAVYKWNSLLTFQFYCD